MIANTPNPQRCRSGSPRLRRLGLHWCARPAPYRLLLVLGPHRTTDLAYWSGEPSQSPQRRMPWTARPCTVQMPSGSWVAGAAATGS